MKKIVFSMLAVALLTGISLAQGSAESQTSGSASQSTSASADKSGAQATAANQVAAGSTIQATLAKPVDARKNKAGDEVAAKTTEDVKSNGKVVLPKGSKIVGHVTDVQAREKGQQESHVAIAFERAVSKNGTQMPLALTLQAIGSSQTSAAMDDSMAGSTMADENMPRTATSSGSATRGALGGVTSTPGRVVNTAGSAAGGTLNGVQSAGAGVAGGLTSTSQGVVGLPGLTLSSAASNSTSAG